MKDPYKSDNRNYKERQNYADIERERYLAKLQAKSDRRDNERVLRDMAFAVGEEHAAKTSQKHLGSIAKQMDFRSQVRETWLASHKTHEDMHRKLGQIYRDRLEFFVDRSLEGAASVRSEFEHSYRSRKEFKLSDQRQQLSGEGNRS